MTTPALVTRDFSGLTIPQPGTFVIDASHATVGFVARHLVVSKVRGQFSQVTGTVTIAENPLDSSVEASIPTASISTNQPDRDNHLRSDDFLNAEKFPAITFRSTGLVSHSGSDFVLTGDLTIRDVTQPVELKVEFDGVAMSPYGQEVIAFTATTEIDREKFGVTWNQALEAGGMVVGNLVKVEIVAEATRQV